jgi:hypothetical protein
VHAPPRHDYGEEPSALHRVGPWIPVTPVVLVPTLAGGDTRLTAVRVGDGAASVEHRAPRSALIRGDLEDFPSPRSKHRPEPILLTDPTEPAQILLADSERGCESTEVDRVGLRERHQEHVARTAIFIRVVERADHRATDEHARLRAAEHDTTVA